MNSEENVVTVTIEKNKSWGVAGEDPLWITILE